MSREVTSSGSDSDGSRCERWQQLSPKAAMAAGRTADDPRQHARQRRAVARCVLLAVPPPGDPERPSVARSHASAIVWAARGGPPHERDIPIWDYWAIQLDAGRPQSGEDISTVIPRKPAASQVSTPACISQVAAVCLRTCGVTSGPSPASATALPKAFPILATGALFH
jgi:hypothetical protein